jgi:AraC-like DNA-binding protein
VQIAIAEHIKLLTPLERFLGADTPARSIEQHAINNLVHAEWLQVAMPEDEENEDKGMLFLFPVDDHKFALQLCYLQYTADSTNATVCTLKFHPAFLEMYPPETLMANQPFRFDRSADIPFPICSKSRLILRELGNDEGAEKCAMPFIRSLHLTELATKLLRCALECMTQPFDACQVPACSFLAYDSEREKILEARQILDMHIDQPLTIKQLSRKVAMNECYLKKGFKMVTGKTIHEYQQERRINKAKELLQQNGRTVTDVANTLGFNSISHFSTAFKRVTGMKPCELLA